MAIDDYCLLTPLFGLPGLSRRVARRPRQWLLLDCTPEFLPERAWLSGASQPGDYCAWRSERRATPAEMTGCATSDLHQTYLRLTGWSR